MNADAQKIAWKAGAEACKDRKPKGVCAYGVWRARCRMERCPALKRVIEAGVKALGLCEKCGEKIVRGPFTSGCVVCQPSLARPCGKCEARVVECCC